MAYVPQYNVDRRNTLLMAEQKTLGDAAEALQKRHDLAIAAATETKAALASLDLNPAEAEYIQQKSNEIDSLLTDNTNFGNAAQAYNALVKFNGDIKTDPVLMGKLQSQKEYKAFQDELDKTNLDNESKEYFRQANPYTYTPKVDDKGNVVGAEQWKPNEIPVNSPDIEEFYKNASKYISPSESTNTVTRFLDLATGKITNTYTPGSTPVYYSTITNTYEVVSPEKVKEGFYAWVNSNPEILKGFMQDYKISKWKNEKGTERFNKNGEVDDNLTGGVTAYSPSGTLYSPSEYLEKRIENFTKSYSYTKNINDEKVNAAGLNMLLKSTAAEDSDVTSKKGLKSDILKGYYSMPRSSAGVKLASNAPNVAKQVNATQMQQSVYSWIKQYYPNAEVDLKTMNYNDVYNSIIKSKPNLSDADKQEVADTLKFYYVTTMDGRAITNSIANSMGNDGADVNNLNNMLVGGKFNIDTSNLTSGGQKFIEEVSEINNNIYNGHEYAGYRVKNKNILNSIKTAAGDKWNEWGLTTTTINGDDIIVIPKSAQEAIYPILQIFAAKQEDSVSDYLGRIFYQPSIVSGENIRNTGIAPLSKNDDGNYVFDGNKKDPVNLFRKLSNISNKAQNQISDVLRDEEPVELTVPYRSGSSIDEEWNKQMYLNTGNKKFDDVASALREEVENAVQPGTLYSSAKLGGLDVGIPRIDGGYEFIPIDLTDENHAKLLKESAGFIRDAKAGHSGVLNGGRYFMPQDRIAPAITLTVDNNSWANIVDGKNNINNPNLDTKSSTIMFVFRDGLQIDGIDTENQLYSTKRFYTNQNLTIPGQTSAASFQFDDTWYTLIHNANNSYKLMQDMDKGDGFDTGLEINDAILNTIIDMIAIQKTHPAFQQGIEETILNAFANFGDIVGYTEQELNNVITSMPKHE